MDDKMVKISEKELDGLREMKKEFAMLKKALVVGSTWEYDGDGNSTKVLTLTADKDNPYIKAMGEIDKKISEELVPRISLILNHIGFRYSDDPRLVKNNCVGMD